MKHNTHNGTAFVCVGAGSQHVHSVLHCHLLKDTQHNGDIKIKALPVWDMPSRVSHQASP